MKDRHARSMAKASGLIRTAKADQTWDWCRKAKLHLPLEESVEALAAAVACDRFTSAAVSRELNALKKMLGLDDAQFEVKLQKFIDDISMTLDKVDVEVTRLQGHADAEMGPLSLTAGVEKNKAAKKRKV